MAKENFGEWLESHTHDIESSIKEITKMYEKNEIIESFVLLHGLVEHKMNMMWVLSLIVDRGYYVKTKYWNFNEISNLLRESNLIGRHLFTSLLALNKGRNQTVHYFGNRFDKNAKIHKNTLNDQLNKGIHALHELEKIHSDLIDKFLRNNS